MATEYANKNKIIFMDECSAKFDISIKETFNILIETMAKVQLSQIEEGNITKQGLKLNYEEE